MDFSLKDICVPEQKDEIPFIGDVMNLEEMENFEVNSKKVHVTSISFNGQKLLANVAVTADYSDVPAIYDHIVVGVRVVLSKGRSVKEDITAIWSVPEAQRNLREISIDIEVTPGNLILKAFWVMNIYEFSAIRSIPSALKLRYQHTNELEMVNEMVGRVLKEYFQILVNEDKDQSSKLRNFAWNLNNFLADNISKRVLNLSAENWIYATFYIVKNFMWAQERVEAAATFIQGIDKKYAKKREIINVLSGKQVKYFSNWTDFEKFLKSTAELYAIFINLNGWMASQQIFKDFLRMKSQLSADFVAVDLDLIDVKGLKPFVVKSYKNGYCESENVMQEIKNATKTLAKCEGKRQKLAPKARAVLDIACPGFHSLDCPNVNLKWVCFDCQSQLYYGFDDHLYCYCGGADVSQFKFRCGRVNHDEFLALKNRSVLKSLQRIAPLNIIILGQSGVGKSTWINAFVNYMTFKSLDEARSSEFPVPIPVKFSVTEENCKQVDVICGKYEEDENLKTGESATQNCKEYNIIFENKIINLIDTPGLGDTRGIDEDKKNVKKILDYLRQVDNIHGICLVLKPNEARITVLLKYCLKEILSNLHKSCKENLIFCFTHSRQTFYRAGETLPTLQALLTEIGVNQSCLQRSFHMDNEAFRFLCCQSANIKFTKDEEESFAESWDRSAKATKKLLDEVSVMAPHSTSETLSLNRARNIILTLIPFMVEISENIERNLQQLESRQKMISAHSGTLDELKNQRFSTQIDIERTPLNHPRTVCAYEKCVLYEFLSQSGERQAIYKSHCHAHCYLSGQYPDKYPNPELLGCAAMRGTRHCQMCKCKWDIHMHIWYDQKLTENLVKDEDIERQINNYQDSSVLKADLIAADQRRITNLENEKKLVISNCVKFACFLQANAIIAYNDSFLDYFEMTLRTLENLEVKTALDTDRITKMKETKQLYLEERKIFSDAASKDNVSVTLDDISKSEKQLYELPIHGEQLRQIMKAAIANQNNAPRDGSNSKTIHAHSKKGTLDKAAGVLRAGWSLSQSELKGQGFVSNQPGKANNTSKKGNAQNQRGNNSNDYASMQTEKVLNPNKDNTKKNSNNQAGNSNNPRKGNKKFWIF